MMTSIRTKSQETAADLAALLRARNPLIYIVTKEEARVEGYVFAAAAAAKYEAFTWDCAAGVAKFADALGNSGHLSIRMKPRVFRVWQNALDGPLLNLQF